MATLSPIEDHPMQFRVYSETNPKINLKLDLTRDLFPYVGQEAKEKYSQFILKWERRIYAGDRLDEFERLIHLKGKGFFEDKVVKLKDSRNRRAMFFKVDMDPNPFATQVVTNKIKQYDDTPPYDLYLFDLRLEFKKMVMMDLNIMDMDKLTPALSEHLA